MVLLSGSTCIFIAAVLTCLVWYVFQHYWRKYKNFPPGPIPWPVLGNILSMDPKPYKSFKEWADHYDTKLMSVKLGPQKCLVINDSTCAREMFSDFMFSGRPQCYFTQVLSGGSYGILVSEDKQWEQQRRFTLRHLRDFGFSKSGMQTLIKESVGETIEWLRSEKGEPLSSQVLQKKLSLAVLSSLWTVVSGQKCSVDESKLLELLDALQEGGSAITRHPLIVVAPWIRHILPGLSGYTTFQTVVDKMHNFIQETVDEHTEDFQHEWSNEEPKDFIESYLQEIVKTKDKASSFYGEEGLNNLKAVVGDLFQGGSETTGITLTWVILFLTTHPEEQKKLQNEIDSVVGHSRQPQLYDRLKMPFTEAIILETGRLGSVIPLGVFHTARADTQFHQYYIPKGTWIWYNQYAGHMDSHVWGDPEIFRPERFLSKNGESVLRNQENYLPFSVGKRECPGKSLAYDTLFLFIACLFQRFTAVPASDFEVPGILDSDDGFFRMPKQYWVKMKPRATTMNTPITITVN